MPSRKGTKNLTPAQKASIVLAKNMASVTRNKKGNAEIATAHGVSENRVDSLKYEKLSAQAKIEYEKQVKQVKFKTMKIVDKGLGLIEKKMGTTEASLRDIVGATKTAFDIHQLQTMQPTSITQQSEADYARFVLRKLAEQMQITETEALEEIRIHKPQIYGLLTTGEK